MDKIVINADEAKKKPLEELLKKLSSSKKGMSSSEAQKRLQEYGSNEISEKKPSNTKCLRPSKTSFSRFRKFSISFNAKNS